jgi:hypothetical protein
MCSFRLQSRADSTRKCVVQLILGIHTPGQQRAERGVIRGGRARFAEMEAVLVGSTPQRRDARVCCGSLERSPDKRPLGCRSGRSASPGATRSRVSEAFREVKRGRRRAGRDFARAPPTHPPGAAGLDEVASTSTACETTFHDGSVSEVLLPVTTFRRVFDTSSSEAARTS